MNKILLIQTAYIGDVILATPLIEKLAVAYPQASIDFLVRAGNEGLLLNNPHLNKVLIWQKKNQKYSNLRALSLSIRKQRYDAVFNLHRFATSGLLTAFSGARHKIGFDKNPLAFAYTVKVPHCISDGLHEVERNLSLLKGFADTTLLRPQLYPSPADVAEVQQYLQKPFVCMAPASVWFTKQWPGEKWVELITHIPAYYTILMLGSKTDSEWVNKIIQQAPHKHCINLCGKLSLLQSAALMQQAEMNYVNDSAPLHIASAMNAPVTAFFCSTVPAFGFGPLSDNKKIAQTTEHLPCRPCGLHGRKACPEKHFRCATSIQVNELIPKEK